MLKNCRSWVVRSLALAVVCASVSSGAWAVGTEPGDIIGTVVSVFKNVDVLPGGKGNTWVKEIKAGYKLSKLDILRTGTRGRARIEFADRYQDKNSGPSVINVASETEIQMSKFEINLKDSTKNEGIFDLVRGAIRAFSKGWGGRAAFSVRTGTSLCGIRGSEEVVAYVPGTASVADLTTQSCLDGNCGTEPRGTFRRRGWIDMETGVQRLMPSQDPKTWKDVKLTQKQRQELIGETGVPGVSDEGSEEQKFLGRLGSLGDEKIPEGGPWMGVRWTPDGLPDCQAEVADLLLNTYRWDDIKDQRNFTFYQDELIGGRFVVSGQIQTQCPMDLLQVEVSVDGGSSWARALFSAQAGTFRYEFDPTGFTDLDLRVRPTFQKSLVERYRSAVGSSN